MKCVICKGHFYYASLSGPHETCDCGQEIEMEYFAQMDEEEIGRARASWKQQQAEAPAASEPVGPVVADDDDLPF